MRNRKKTIIMAASMFVCVLLGALVYCGTRYWAEEPLSDNRTVQWKKDETKMFGTEENPFLILEIVPDKIESQIGYFIPGCEPINMKSNIVRTSEVIKGDITSQTFNGVYDLGYETVYAFYDQIPADTSFPVYTESNDSHFRTRTDITYTNNKPNYGVWAKGYQGDYTQRGDWIEKAGGGFTKQDSYVYVENGKGDYAQGEYYEWVGPKNGDATKLCYVDVGEGNGEYEWVPSETGESMYYNWQKGDWVKQAGGRYNYTEESDEYLRVTQGYGEYLIKYGLVYVGDGNGNALRSESYNYVGAGLGEYEWVPSEEGAYERKQNGDLFCYTYIDYKHKDQFIQFVFSEEIEEIRNSMNPEELKKLDEAGISPFKSQVITLTPKDFEKNKDYLNIIDVADLINIHGAPSSYDNLAKIYSMVNGVEVPASKPTFWDDGNDLTYETVMRIVKRMGSDNPAALYFDIVSMFNKESEYNVHKLLYMTMSYKPNFFWDTFKDYLVKEKVNGKETVKYTGKFSQNEGEDAGNEDARIYWGKSYETTEWSWSCNLEGDSHKEHTNKNSPYKTATNPFLFHPETGEYLGDRISYYNINSGDYNIFDKVFTYHGDNTGLHDFLTGGNIEPTGMKGSDLSCSLFANTSTIDAFTGEYADRNSLTNLEAMRFILKRRSTDQPKLRILEIQPCDEFIYGSDGWKEYYQALFPWYNPKTTKENWLDDESLITVTTMPTWEFIGSTGRYDYNEKDKLLTTESSDDLIAKYDLIIIGSNQDASNAGLTYTAIGGEFSDGTRHPGNDITLKKLLELQDFLRAGKPIVADDGLYTGGQVDKAKVDQSSKVYDLLTWKETGSENIFIHDSIDGNKMKTLISKGICRLEFFEDGYPDMYNYQAIDKKLENGEKIKDVIGSNIIYNKNGSTLEFHFFIRGTSDDTYSIALNLDLNGDGIYSGSRKERSEVENMNVATGKSNATTGELEVNVDGDGVYYGMLSQKDSEGNAIPRLLVCDSKGKEVEIEAADKNASNGPYYYKLKANTEYTAICTLKELFSEKVRGMIPWKLEVQSNTNAARRSSAIGYTLIKAETSDGEEREKEKVKIRVLQMNLQLNLEDNDSSIDSSNYNQDHNFTAFTAKSIVVKAGEDYEAFDRRNPDGEPEPDFSRLYQDMSSAQKQTVEKFEKYIEPVEEFDVDIQYLFNSDWYQLFGTKEKDKNNDDYKRALDNWNDFLADYDMLVFGFVDGCTFTNDPVFVDGVKNFIAQGKGMILSHDMVGNPDYGCETDIALWLREESGQYRTYYNKNGSSYVESYEKVLANGAEIKILDDRDNENYLAVTLSDKTERVAKDGKINDLVWVHPFSRQTTFVKLTNNGQITTYPYKLGNVLEVLSSHTQYYQLDLEHQQSGDVNVWFNLSDMHDSDVKKFCQDMNITGTDEQKQINLYSAKDQDCRNSFYIYNKGNITYTGSGHGEGFFGQANGLMTDDEVMLFINTMVAAYRQPDPQPYAEIDNADVTASNGSKVFYLNYYESTTSDGSETADGSKTATKKGMDSRIKELTLGGATCECVGIQFTIHDIAGAKGTDKKYYIRLSHGGNLMADGSEVIVKELDNAGKEKDEPLKRQDSTSPYYQVELGKSYIMYVPYADVANDGGVAKYTISTHATYLKGGRLATTPPTEENAQVMLMPLFELN